MNTINKQTSQTLIGAIFVMVVVTMTMVFALTRMNIQQQEALWRLESQAAFHAAESGIAHALSRLRSNSSWGIGEPELRLELRNTSAGTPGELMGFYSVEVAEVQAVAPGWEGTYVTLATTHGVDPELPDPHRERWIRAVGWDRLERRERSILVRVRLVSPADFMTATLGALHIGSGANIGSDIFGRDIYFNVDTSLPLIEQGITVDGDAVYLRDIHGHEQPGIVNITGTPQQSSSLSFATIDLAFFKQVAQDLHGGSARFYDTGQTIDLGSLPPGVNLIYVEGEVRIKGQYDRSLTVISEGDTFITGSITAASSDPRPQMALLSAKDVIIPEDFIGEGAGGNDLHIESFVMADGQGDSAGVFTAEGADGQHAGTLTFTGAMTARGRGLVDESAVRLSAFQTRDYVYNTEFVDNRSIPYMPLAVNLRSWQQVRLGADFPPNCLYFLGNSGNPNVCAD